jgi:hypothetical protein
MFLAVALANAAFRHGKTSHLGQVDRLLEELRELQAQYPEQPEIARLLALMSERNSDDEATYDS